MSELRIPTSELEKSAEHLQELLNQEHLEEAVIHFDAYQGLQAVRNNSDLTPEQSSRYLDAIDTAISDIKHGLY